MKKDVLTDNIANDDINYYYHLKPSNVYTAAK